MEHRDPATCPHIKRYSEGPDFCREHSGVCLLETGLICDEWEDTKAEWAEEDQL